RRHSKLGRIVADPHRDAGLVLVDVVHPVRHRLATCPFGEVVNVHVDRATLRAVGAARILVVPQKFLLLRINRDRRLASPLARPHPPVDVAELAVRGRGVVCPPASCDYPASCSPRRPNAAAPTTPRSRTLGPGGPR